MDQKQKARGSRLTWSRRELIAGVSSTVVARPLAARAQQKAMPVIGYLHFGSPLAFADQADAFRQGLRERGYVEGKNVTIEYRWAEGHDDRLRAMADDLVSHGVGAIAAIGPMAARSAQKATSTIPIIFMVGTDPVADGLIDSLARPGGNLTGSSMLAFDLTPKRLGLILELAPQAGTVALLVNPNNTYAEHMIDAAQKGARATNVQLSILKASSVNEIDAAFTSMTQSRARALLVDPEPFFTSRSEQIVELAARDVIPAIYGWRLFPQTGGLISYGPSLATTVRQVGDYVGRVLKGENPASLPVQQPTTFELVINLRTANTLGLTVPQLLLGTADEILH